MNPEYLWLADALQLLVEHKANIRRRVSVVKRKLSAFTTTVVVVVFLTTLGAAQTQRQLEEKYPKVDAYLVRPNILLTARY
jgi:hypothetical protein